MCLFENWEEVASGQNDPQRADQNLQRVANENNWTGGSEDRPSYELYDCRLKSCVVVRSRSGDNDLLWGDDQRAFRFDRAFKGFLSHLAEQIKDRALRYIFGGPLNLVALCRGRVTGGNGDFPIGQDEVPP